MTPENTWQLIETAPKDGTRILAYRVSRHQYTVYWDSEVNEWFIIGDRYTNDLTHWMPLPKPPIE